MLDADLVFDTGHFSYADAEHLADLWNTAYPAMREIATRYINGKKIAIEGRSWEVDPNHPQAEALRQLLPKEAELTRRMKRVETLRRELGQLDRGTHKPCTRSPGCFSVTAAYMAVRSLLSVSSLSSEGLAPVYRLAAELAEAEEKVNAERAVWHKETSGEGETSCS